MNYTNIYFVSISLSGYSAKYSTYSFQDDATKEIMHFELVQVNQHTSYKMNCQDTTWAAVLLGNICAFSTKKLLFHRLQKLQAQLQWRPWALKEAWIIF